MDRSKELAQAADGILDLIGVGAERFAGGTYPVVTPLTGDVLAHVRMDEGPAVRQAIDRASAAFPAWAMMPAPARGEIVRRFGELLRQRKADIADLITLEVGKIRTEALGEVQEMIDVCDFAVGLSRQLYGKTMGSERPGHRLMESWHPLGPVTVITAFNFPGAVWAWNAAIALICGDTVLWKPSERTPLTALACSTLLDEVLLDAGHPDVHQLVLADRVDADPLLDDPRVRLVSATGSTQMGLEVGPRVQRRFARTILELGGNNAAVVCPSADLDMAVRACVFGAVGTAGQRCTTLRRLIVQDSIADRLLERLVAAYKGLPIGNPWRDDHVMVGPLVDAHAQEGMMSAIREGLADGGTLLTGGARLDVSEGAYVEPAIVEMPEQTAVVRRETFAPVLWVMRYEHLDEAISVHNDVPQGLSSSIFTRDLLEAERFIGPSGSDCGIVNVNVGPSGAEIGGAFGGEKETGGGRETGSDAWKFYMRRATNTVNFSDDLILAQGVTF